MSAIDVMADVRLESWDSEAPRHGQQPSYIEMGIRATHLPSGIVVTVPAKAHHTQTHRVVAAIKAITAAVEEIS